MILMAYIFGTQHSKWRSCWSHFFPYRNGQPWCGG